MIFRVGRARTDAPCQPVNRQAVDDWPRIIQNLLFPPTCLLCGDPGYAGRDLCRRCTDTLPYPEHACPVCGLPLAAPDPQPCGACQKQPPPFDRLIAALRYEEPARHLIQALKFRARYAHARLLGTLLAERVNNAPVRPEVIIPVPLHPARYRERTFNQSLEIARVVSRRTGIPLDYTACRRVRHTAAQTGLPAKERRRNIRKAFSVTTPLTYRHIAILDDVVTTAATVGELARTLRRAGADTITVWACARTAR